jgi:predicted transcriptional regulator
MFQSKQEKEKLVIDLYSQGKTYRQIAEEVRISPNDIHAILKKEEEEKNNSTVTNDQQQSCSSFATTKAYELFSKGERPVEVAIALNLREPEVTKMYRQYWKLKNLHKLNLIYKETNGKLGPFLKLYRRLIKQKGMSLEQVVNAVEIAANRLPYMETLYGQAKDQAEKMQRALQRLENYSHTLNEEIASSKELLQSYHISCQRKRQESENLNNELYRLEAVISRFKHTDEEYLKIKNTVEEKVSSVLSDGKVILQFALASVIEALRRNPDKYNNLLVSNTLSSSTAITSAQQVSSPSQYDEKYNAMILEVADKLYNTVLKQLVSTIMDNTSAEHKSSSSQSKLP